MAGNRTWTESLKAYRQLSKVTDYPLHLGITESGSFIPGSIKSSIGLGLLLLEGIGDTIRVSLTEEPEFEIPVAQALVEKYENRNKHDDIPKIDKNILHPFEYNLRDTDTVINMGGDNVPRVMADLCYTDKITPDSLTELGYTYFKEDDKWGISDLACDYIDIGKKEIDFNIPGTLGIMQHNVSSAGR